LFELVVVAVGVVGTSRIVGGVNEDTVSVGEPSPRFPVAHRESLEVQWD
jgi:hypothetical protein